MEKTDQQIFEEFAGQLCRWGEDGKTPASGNQDIQYGLDLQKVRLEKNHAKIIYRLKPREENLGLFKTAVFKDVRYTNKLAWKAFQKEVDYFVNGRKCLSLKGHEYLYTIITWLNGANIQASYCCPNCGSISNVSELLQGCPYCRTRFIMSDLFPKVTNYYFLRDYSLGERESKKDIRKSMIIGALIGLLIRLPGAVIDIMNGDNVVLILFTVLMAAGVFAVFGYFALSLKLICHVLKDGFKQAPRAAGLLDAKKRLTDFMKQFEPDFAFEYFLGKVQALVKILIFSDDQKNLAIYEGRAEEISFGNIIDSQFDGAVSVEDGRVEGNYCYLDLNVYMTDIYCNGGQLSQRSDRFQIGLCRNICRPVDYGFSVKKVTCRNCGASFDATREQGCPYCKSRYDLKEDDWVITYIRKK